MADSHSSEPDGGDGRHTSETDAILTAHRYTADRVGGVGYRETVPSDDEYETRPTDGPQAAAAAPSAEVAAAVKHGASRADYAGAFGTPGMLWPVLASLVARLPIAMGSISMLLYVQSTSGTFGDAGFVSGAALFGLAVGSVTQGKLIDRFGPTRSLGTVLLIFLPIAAAVFFAIETRAPLPVLIAVAFAFGLTQPAISPASRGLWGRKLPVGSVREAAYTYEAISLETFFILGPALAGLLATSAVPAAGLMVTVLLFVVGTTLFVSAPVVRRWRPALHPDGVRAKGTQLIRRPGVQTMLLLVLGFGLVIGFGEVAIPAAAIEAGYPALGGILLGVWSISSVIFGIFYAARPWPRALHVRGPALLATFAILVGLMGLTHGLLWLTVALLVSGLMITPQATLHSLLVDRVAPDRYSAEAFGWVTTAVTIGLGIGQASAGQLVEAFGYSTALLVAAIPGALLALWAWLRRGTLMHSSLD